jgi:O-antigen/teichoic acid export membrane protein
LSKIKNIIQKIHDISTLGIADIGGSAIGAIFWFFTASLVGVENYGQISYFLAISGTVSALSLVGASNMLLVNVPKGIKIQPPMFLISIICGLISSTILFFIFFKFEVSIATIGFVVFNLVVSELLGLRLYKIYLRYVITQKILMAVLGISFYYLFGPYGVILGVGLSYLSYFIRVVKVFRNGKIDFSLIKTRSGFLMNSYILDLSNALIGSFDKIIIGPLFGFVILGNYQLGIQFWSVLIIIPNIFYKFLVTQEAGGNSTGKMTKFVILTAVIIALLGIFVSPIILPLLFPKFIHATNVLQIISFAVIPNAISLIFISKFMACEKIRIVLFGSIIFLGIQIPSIILLGREYGINGIAASVVLSESIQTIYYVMIRKILR